MADYGTEQLLQDVIDLADSMEMETFDLVGHDWGGMLAWVVASRHPGRVRTLSVVSTPHPLALHEALRGADPGPGRHGASMDAFRAPEVPERLLLGADGAGGGLATVLAETGLDDEDARMYVAALVEPGALTAALNWYRAMDGSGAPRPQPGVRAHALRLVHRATTAFGRAAAEDTAECVQGPYTFEVSRTCRTGSRDGARRAVGPPDPPPRRPVPRRTAERALGACENDRVSDSTFALTDVQRDFRETLRAFSEEKMAPNAAEADRTAEYPGSRSRPARRWSSLPSASPRPTAARAPTP